MIVLYFRKIGLLSRGGGGGGLLSFAQDGCDNPKWSTDNILTILLLESGSRQTIDSLQSLL